MVKSFIALSVLVSALFLVQERSYAQPDLDVFLRTSLDDANKFMDAYLEPLANATSASLVNGWYNTARPHKSLGFDLTITANAVFIPDADLTFNVNNLNLENTRLVTPSDGIVPTVLGADDLSSTYEYGENNIVEGTFEGPDGFALEENFGMQAVPVPMVQLGIGILQSTDLKLRITPKIRIDDAEFQMFGGAVMHSISQYIYGSEAPMDISVIAGYTHITMEYSMVNSGVSEVRTDDGRSKIKIRGWTIQGVASKEWGVLTLYGGLGYNFASSDMDMLGEYRVSDEAGNLQKTVIDPVDLSFSQNSPRATLGFRLKFSVITLNAGYTLQRYNTLTAGIGVSVN